MRIFLISGKAGSGKNETANVISDLLGNTVITSFSKYIKLFAMEMTDWDGNEDNKPRTFLQEMGDTLRGIDENFLTKRVLEDIRVYGKYYDNVVISDVRLLNEIEYFKSNSIYDVITIRVNSVESRRKLAEEEKKHITELELDNYDGFDFVIDNNFDDDLEKKIKLFLEGLK